MTSVAGIVLCGGQSRRMGRPKATLPFGPQTLIERVIQRVVAAVDPVLVVAAVEQELPRLPAGVPVVRDREPFEGPLSGLLGGFNELPAATEAAFVTGCDAPFLVPKLIRGLVGQMGDHDAVIPKVADRPQPLLAVYRVGAARVAAQRCRAVGLARMLDLVQHLETRWIDEPELRVHDPALESFLNVNTPADYAAALRRAGFV